MAEIAELQRKMEASLKSLAGDLQGLRTGRASTNLLDSVQVEAYGSFLPINQCANVTAPEPRLLSVQVWDKGMVKAVEKAIANAGLGLNPQADGQLIRVPLPELSEERRKELVKVAGKYAESGRVAIRNIRRDGNDFFKKEEKDNGMSKDEAAKKVEQIQKMTDEHIKKVDEMLRAKEAEIMKV